VLLPYSTSLVAAALGILKSGGAFVLLDPGLPEERLAYLLRDSGAAAVLWSATGSRPRQFARTALVVEELFGSRAVAPELEIHPVNLAHLIYSSGTTGRPKAAMVEHAAFADFVAWAVEAYGHRAGGRCLLATPVAYDGTILQMFPPLVSG